jgi:hypothetical protein
MRRALRFFFFATLNLSSRVYVSRDKKNSNKREKNFSHRRDAKDMKKKKVFTLSWGE